MPDCVVCLARKATARCAVCSTCNKASCIDCASRVQDAMMCCADECDLFHLGCPHCRAGLDVDYSTGAVSKAQFMRIAKRSVRSLTHSLEALR